MMDLSFPSGHSKALNPHSLGLIQSMFVPLKEKEINKTESDLFCLSKTNNTVTEK